MDILPVNITGEEKMTEISSGCRKATILEGLKDRERTLKEKLASVTAAREALESNPEVSKVLELLAKAR